MKKAGINKVGVVLILHDIRSAENVGAIFRTADACGVSKIYLTGYTPTPIDRFGRPRLNIHKSALGAEGGVAWEAFKDVSAILKRLKKEDVTIAAVEQTGDSIDYKKAKPKKPFALIFGNEVSGVPSSVIKRCDMSIEIPMRGMKESLNVSVAAGIVLSRLTGL